MDNETWLPIAEAVTILHKSERTLRRWVAAGRLPTMSDSAGRLLVNVAALSGARQAVPEPADVAAQLAECRTKCQALEAERDALREERDYLRSALAAALQLQQRALPAPGKRPWWAFWRRGEEQGEG